ncbi:sugar-binding transcriptional regulator [Lentibacillus saliphilus]|uniref:sugar-binding transcriptional regulator n=1 Tax=Lentibacillus saliphilus TaxID=2737028 RepID=UPI001C2F189E|nr:sugar-binding domain-containing protein [Lentibacillus saliphilus]
MESLIELQKKLCPELIQTMQDRYMILRSIDLFQPIGRRALADQTNSTERAIRSEVRFLQDQGLIHVSPKGMRPTKEGHLVLEQLAPFMGELTRLNVLEERLQDILQLEECIIVPGNSDQENWVKQYMGQACVSFLKNHLDNVKTIGVTGGATMAAVADMMTPLDNGEQMMFVPARGGLGEHVENQANSIAAQMAKKANGAYRLLYVPDPLSETTYQSMMKEPGIQEVMQLIKQADMIIHGIGDALTMARRRKESEDVIESLKIMQAASEAFGYYFDDSGQIVHKVRTAGIQLEDLQSIDSVIAVAGGSSKARAIHSYFKTNRTKVLITDEAAAQHILRDHSL